jgi:hypothetical protein
MHDEDLQSLVQSDFSADLIHEQSNAQRSSHYGLAVIRKLKFPFVPKAGAIAADILRDRSRPCVGFSAWSLRFAAS